MKYWIGVASKDHVEIGVAGGFCQLNHGKRPPLTRMHEGDKLFYYSPKVSLQSAQPYQKITAFGTIADERIYQVEMFEGFFPYRRDVVYEKDLHEVSLDELNSLLEWKECRSKLRFGHFEISNLLYEQIKYLMMQK